MSSSPPSSYSFLVSFEGISHSFTFPSSATLSGLTRGLQENFKLQTCKIIGITKTGKIPPPDTILSDIKSLKVGEENRLLLLGQRAEALEALASQDEKFQREILRENKIQQQRKEEEERLENQARIDREAAEISSRLHREAQARAAAQMAEERKKEEIERKARELAEEQSSEATISFSLTALSSPEAEKSGKIILSADALRRIIQAKIAFPLTFRIEKENSGENHMNHDEEDEKADSHSSSSSSPSCYSGVSDFSCPLAEVAFLPQKFFQQLKIEEMTRITLKSEILEKASSLSLRALNREWRYLSPDEQKALLEFSLRQFPFLNRGQEISFPYNPHFPVFSFRIEGMIPEGKDILSLIDAEITTEVNFLIEEEEEKTTGGGNSQEIKEYGSGGGGEKLKYGDSRTGILQHGEFHYYSFDYHSREIPLSIHCSSIEGDSCIYLSHSQPRPHYRGLYDICSQRWKENSIEIPREFPTGEYFIGIYGFSKESCKFQLEIKIAQTPATTTASSASSSSSLPSSSSTSSDVSLCPICHQEIPRKSLQMHEISCEKRNFYCPECRLGMKREEREKHQQLVHTVMECSCDGHNKKGFQEELKIHRAELTGNCPERFVCCNYCPLRFPSAARGIHQADCGLRQGRCPNCQQEFPRKKIRRHMAEIHGRDERAIGWKEFH